MNSPHELTSLRKSCCFFHGNKPAIDNILANSSNIRT
jgi:hypothetical protein